MRIKFTSIVLTLLIGAAAAQANEGGHASWQRAAENEVANLASLQRGARNFMAYCSGCHSLKYARYSRIAEDLKISDETRDQLLVKPGAKFTDYIRSSMPEQDATEWFGKVPPDLSLVARSRSPDWIFNFLTTFYADPASRQTGVNNLQLPGTAMPHVLSSLQGVQRLKPVHKEEEKKEGAAATSNGSGESAAESGHSDSPFEPGVVGSLTPAQYDGFVRDTVNFLQYVSDPTQVERQGLGIWVVLFLLMFTAIAYLLKQEYWKDVR
ncbi:MAG TPA: cytochrome c1 [Steroidobacteraceae bacterium]|nr:cytochrome c1 [Steroidobacteraceae bacterium]